ncbi:DNA cytosine methyltransferase [Candidatus Parcubacteria bacterium]|nr:MAG: DNA cytosine methyltransferase [Candidatus Parcubacteria bacterium]
MKNGNSKRKLYNITTPSLFSVPQESKTAEFTFIDLFAGIGGTRLGFEHVGGESVFSSEWDKDCQKTYQANFGEIPHGDITKIDAKDIPDFDVLVAGFPCQPFSSIGRRQGFMHATQGTLFYDVLRILKDKNGTQSPKAFLLENVQGLTTHDNGKTLEIIVNSLDEIGYKVFYEVLDSANFGVPQQRKRIYIVGFRKDLFGDDIDFVFPRGNDKKAYICDYLEENVEGYSISEHLQKTYLFKKDDGRPLLVDKKSKIQVKTLVASYHKIQRLTGVFVKDGKTGIRLFTQNECKAIMGFDKNFVIPVSRTQMYRQMGNSVAIPVVEEVAKKILKHLKEIKNTSKNKADNMVLSKQSFTGVI